MIEQGLTRTGTDRLAQTLRIVEVYKSIQGESTWAGLPCTFVRLARCNLRCSWCDTAYSFYGGERRTFAVLLQQVERLGVRLVELTGGEPLAQAACSDFAALLLERGYEVLVETSGSLPINVLPEAAIKIMDLKCPDSGESEKNHWPNIGYLSPARDEVKFVLASRRDYEWARSVIREHHLESRCKCILMSPVFNVVEARAIVEWILEDSLPARFQLQLHKFIWPPNQKGV